jgi:nitroreductase
MMTMTRPDGGPDSGTVRRAIALASRAPSVHNTQPWRWRAGDASVHLFADWSRQVPATDPDGRDLVISCGAALHHVRVALAAFGWATTVHRVPNPADPAHLAAIELSPAEPTEDQVTLSAAIERRRTDRRRLSSWPVSAGDLQQICGAAAAAGALGVVVTDPAALFQLNGAIAQAAIIHDNDPAYTLELALWTGRGRGGHDGILAASIPRTAPRTANRDDHLRSGLRAFPGGSLEQPPGKRYDQRTYLLVIATSSDDVLSRLRAGEAASAALLTATRLGLATCPLSQPLEISGTRRLIRDDVLGGTAVPQLLLRMGWPPTWASPLPRSPRRDVADVFGDLPD